MPSPSNDEMVHDLDIEHLSSSNELGGKRDICARRCRIARWVIVNHDHRHRVDPDGVAKYLTNPDICLICAPLVHGSQRDQAMLRVEQDRPQLLLFERGHFHPNQVDHVIWGDDLRTVVTPNSGQPVGKFQSGFHPSGFRHSDPALLRKLLEIEPQQRIETTVRCQQPLSDGSHRFSLDARVKENRQQLSVAERPGASKAQTFTWALVGLQLLDQQMRTRLGHASTAEGSSIRVNAATIIP